VKGEKLIASQSVSACNLLFLPRDNSCLIVHRPIASHSFDALDAHSLVSHPRLSELIRGCVFFAIFRGDSQASASNFAPSPPLATSDKSLQSRACGTILFPAPKFSGVNASRLYWASPSDDHLRKSAFICGLFLYSRLFVCIRGPAFPSRDFCFLVPATKVEDVFKEEKKCIYRSCAASPC
jgi:hypothetical protein